MNLDALKPAPAMDTVRFESEPPGAEAKTSNGQTCRTPCALALPANAPLTVTFTLNGYQPESENIEPISSTIGTPRIAAQPGAGRTDACAAAAEAGQEAGAPRRRPCRQAGGEAAGLRQLRTLRSDDGSAGAAASARALAGHAAAER